MLGDLQQDCTTNILNNVGITQDDEMRRIKKVVNLHMSYYKDQFRFEIQIVYSKQNRSIMINYQDIQIDDEQLIKYENDQNQDKNLFNILIKKQSNKIITLNFNSTQIQWFIQNLKICQDFIHSRSFLSKTHQSHFYPQINTLITKLYRNPNKLCLQYLIQKIITQSNIQLFIQLFECNIQKQISKILFLNYEQNIKIYKFINVQQILNIKKKRNIIKLSYLIGKINGLIDYISNTKIKMVLQNFTVKNLLQMLLQQIIDETAPIFKLPIQSQCLLFIYQTIKLSKIYSIDRILIKQYLSHIQIENIIKICIKNPPNSVLFQIFFLYITHFSKTQYTLFTTCQVFSWIKSSIFQQKSNYIIFQILKFLINHQQRKQFCIPLTNRIKQIIVFIMDTMSEQRKDIYIIRIYQFLGCICRKIELKLLKLILQRLMGMKLVIKRKQIIMEMISIMMVILRCSEYDLFELKGWMCILIDYYFENKIYEKKKGIIVTKYLNLVNLLKDWLTCVYPNFSAQSIKNYQQNFIQSVIQMIANHSQTHSENK